MYIRFVRRLTPSRSWTYLVPVISILLSLTLGAIILASVGASPVKAYKEMFSAAFGSLHGLSETLVKATPIMLAGLGLAVAFRMLLWNIGAEGQLHMGAFAATWVGLNLSHWPAHLQLPAMVISGFAAGAWWGAIPGYLKARLHVNEIITSLLLNYVAILWVDYLVYGPWRDPASQFFPLTPVFSPGGYLPRLFGTRVHLGLIFALVAAASIYVMLKKTRWGFEIRVIGENPGAARYAGMSLAKNIMLVMIVSGGLAGLAGVGEVAGIQHRLQRGISPGYGYTAIIVAWLANNNPWGVVVVSILLGGLLVGSDMIQMMLGLPLAMAYILQGAILFFVLAGENLRRYRMVWRLREAAV